MKRSPRTSLLMTSFVLGLVVCIGACTTGQREDAAAGSEQYQRSADLNMSDVMQAKLIHTQAIVEGMALGSMPQVEANAEALHELSLHASWMVHDTVTYVAMSESFRDTVMALWQHAEANDADAVMNGYLAMAQSCLDCHTYLREERRFRDAPGRRSMILDSLDLHM